MKRNLPSAITRLLLDAYRQQESRVGWAGAKSHAFSATNGVKQGGVLSPLLFTVYMDELLTRLQQSDVGCHIGHRFVGALAYADDLTLLAPDQNALACMIQICSAFAAEYLLTFNAKKTVCIKIGAERTNLDTLRVDNIPVKWEDTCLHLGYKINSRITDTEDCNLKASRFTGQVNRLMGNFGFLSSSVLTRLFTAYCTSFYGAQLWSLGSPAWNRVMTTWRKGVRRILKLPYRTHTWLLPSLLNRPPLQCSLERRFVRFYDSLQKSTNGLARFLALRARHDHSSVIGRNLAYLRCTRGIDDLTCVENALAHINDCHRPSQEHLPLSGLASELLRTREGEVLIEGLSGLEVELLLREICIN